MDFITVINLIPLSGVNCLNEDDPLNTLEVEKIADHNYYEQLPENVQHPNQEGTIPLPLDYEKQRPPEWNTHFDADVKVNLTEEGYVPPDIDVHFTNYGRWRVMRYPDIAYTNEIEDRRLNKLGDMDGLASNFAFGACLFEEPIDIYYFQNPCESNNWTSGIWDLGEGPGTDPSYRNLTGLALGYLFKLELLNHRIVPNQYYREYKIASNVRYNEYYSNKLIERPLSIMEWCQKWIIK